MPTSVEILQSTYHLGKMKRIRKEVIISHIFFAVFLMIMYTLFSSGPQLDPLFLPFESYLFIILMTVLILRVEEFFFKHFGIKWAKSDSERFLMSRDYQRKSVVMIAAAAVVIAAVNVITPIWDMTNDSTEEVLVDGQYNATFWSQDFLGLTGVSVIKLSSDNNVPLDVYILHMQDYEYELFENRLNFRRDQSIGITNLKYEDEDFMSHGEYVIYIKAHGRNATVTYSIERGVDIMLNIYVTVFIGLYGGMNAIWAVYLWPFKKRYEKASIYK